MQEVLKFDFRFPTRTAFPFTIASYGSIRLSASKLRWIFTCLCFFNAFHKLGVSVFYCVTIEGVDVIFAVVQSRHPRTVWVAKLAAKQIASLGDSCHRTWCGHQISMVCLNSVSSLVSSLAYEILSQESARHTELCNMTQAHVFSRHSLAKSFLSWED